jgi:hypothetical protein
MTAGEGRPSDDVWAQNGDEWFSWNTETAETYPELADAVGQFQPDPKHRAGQEAAEWLARHAKREKACMTRLLVVGGEVAAFYAIASAEVTISRPKELQRLGVLSGDASRVPCSHLEWIARAHKHYGAVEKLLFHATAVAQDVAALQGNVVLSLDPYNEQVAKVWRDKYGFRKSRTEIDGLPRMYLPLFGYGALTARQ